MNINHCRRLDRSPEKLSPHLSDENKVAITNLRQSTENIRNFFDKMNNDLIKQNKALDVEKALRKIAEDKLNNHLVDMYKNKAVNTELRSRLPRANKSDPFQSINADKNEVDVHTRSVEQCLSLENLSISGKYKRKARKRNRRRRRLDFEYPYDKSFQRGDKCHSSDTSEDEIGEDRDQKPACFCNNSDVCFDRQPNSSLSQYQQPEEENGYNQLHSMQKNKKIQITSQHEQELNNFYPQHLSPHQSTIKFSTTLPFHTETNFPLQSVPFAQSTPINTNLSNQDSGFLASYGAVFPTDTSLVGTQNPKFTDSLTHNSNHAAKVVSTAKSNDSACFPLGDFQIVTAPPSLNRSFDKQASSVPFSSYTCQDNSPASIRTALFEINPPFNKSPELPLPPPPSRNEQDINKIQNQNEESNAIPLYNELDDIDLLKMQLKTKTLEVEYYQNKTKCTEEIDRNLNECLHLLRERHQDLKISEYTSHGGLESNDYFLSYKEAEEENEQYHHLYKKKEETKQRIIDAEMQALKCQRDFAVKKMKALSQEILQFESKGHALDEGTRMHVSLLKAKKDIYQCENEKLVQENEYLKKVALLKDKEGLWISKFENKLDDLRIDHSIAKYVTGDTTDIDERESTQNQLPSQLNQKQQTARMISSSQLPCGVDEDQVHKLMVKLSMAYRIQDQQQKKIESLNKMVTTLTKKDSDDALGDKE